MTEQKAGKPKPTSFRLSERTLERIDILKEDLGARSRVEALEKAVDLAWSMQVGKKGEPTGVVIEITGATKVNVRKKGDQ